MQKIRLDYNNSCS